MDRETTDSPTKDAIPKPGSTWTTDCTVSTPSAHAPPAFTPANSAQEGFAYDLDGRRYISTDDDQGGVYLLNCHFSTSVARFPVDEGDGTTLNEFRSFIKQYAVKQRVRDGHGKIWTIDDMAPHHLARMQVMLWQDPPASESGAARPLNKITGEDVAVSKAVAAITNVLMKGHFVFVLRDRCHHFCSNPLCDKVHHEKSARQPSSKVVLEPLLDIATLRSASDLRLFNGEIFVFRRDDTKYDRMGFHLNALFPKKRLAFCVECLQFLWDERGQAWAVRKLLRLPQISNANAQYQRGLDVQREACRQVDGVEETEEDGMVVLPMHEHASLQVLDRETECHSLTRGRDNISLIEADLDQGLVSPSSCSQDSQGPPQLDGMIETLPCSGSLFARRRLLHMITMRECNGHKFAFTPNNADSASTYCTPLPPSNSSFDQATAKDDSLYQPKTMNQDRQMLEAVVPRQVKFLSGNQLDSKWKAVQHRRVQPLTPALSNSRVFLTGDGINPKWRAVKQDQQPAPDTVDHTKDEEELASLLQLPADSPFKGTFENPSASQFYSGYSATLPLGPPYKVMYKSIEMDVPPSVDLGLVKPPPNPDVVRKRADITRSSSTIHSEILQAAERAASRTIIEHTSSSALQPTPSPPYRRGSLYVSDSEGSASELEPRSPSAPSHENYPNSSTVSRCALTHHFPPYLDPPELWCLCRQPDDYKKMIQCANLDCPVSWFHYNCLTKAEKLSSRFEPWFCRVCQDVKATWEETTLPPPTPSKSRPGSRWASPRHSKTPPRSMPDRLTDFKMPFEREEILMALEVRGGDVVVDPYGMAGMSMGLLDDVDEMRSEDEDMLDRS